MSSAAAPIYTTLVDVTTLAAHLDAPDWVVVDCRHDLSNPDFGQAAYADGRIPGARFLHLDRDLSGPMTGRNGRHPLPDRQNLARLLGQIGIGDNTQVVAYDDAGGMFAARLWWLLRWLGHPRAAVLDGGYRAWGDAMQPVSNEPAHILARTFTERAGCGVVDAAHVFTHLGRPDMVVIDARSPDRFRGENETLDPVGGHIPGAINRFFRDNLDDDGRFKPPAQLREAFASLLSGHSADAVVHQCGSGVTACHNLLAMEHAGLSGSRLYAGSWSEWCADPARPVATGAI